MKVDMYTKVILTIIAILLFVIVAKPVTKVSTPAYADDIANAYYAIADSVAKNANATQEIAKALKEVAAANKTIGNAVSSLEMK